MKIEAINKGSEAKALAFQEFLGFTLPDDYFKFFLFKKVNEKYSVVVPFDFNDYNDLSQYIVDSSKRLIDISLERTYTLKGKKIKLGK